MGATTDLINPDIVLSERPFGTEARAVVIFCDVPLPLLFIQNSLLYSLLDLLTFLMPSLEKL